MLDNHLPSSIKHLTSNGQATVKQLTCGLHLCLSETSDCEAPGKWVARTWQTSTTQFKDGGIHVVLNYSTYWLKYIQWYLHMHELHVYRSIHKGRDTLTPLPFVVILAMFWQRRSASYCKSTKFYDIWSISPLPKHNLHYYKRQRGPGIPPYVHRHIMLLATQCRTIRPLVQHIITRNKNLE